MLKNVQQTQRTNSREDGIDVIERMDAILTANPWMPDGLIIDLASQGLEVPSSKDVRRDSERSRKVAIANLNSKVSGAKNLEY